MTDKRLSDILNARDVFLRTLDPEGIFKNGKIISLTHRLKLNGFHWKAVLRLPSEDEVWISGNYEREKGFLITHCCLLEEDGNKTEIVLKPSETFFKAFMDSDGLPVRLANVLPKKGQEICKNEELQEIYGIDAVNSAFDALFWDMEGGEQGSTIRTIFNELSLSEQKDGIILLKAIHQSKCRNKIKATVSVSESGLFHRSVLVEIKRNEYESASYCYYVEEDGRKIPSLRLAVHMLSVLDDSSAEVNQRQKRYNIEMPKPKDYKKPEHGFPMEKPSDKKNKKLSHK